MNVNYYSGRFGLGRLTWVTLEKLNLMRKCSIKYFVNVSNLPSAYSTGKTGVRHVMDYTSL